MLSPLILCDNNEPFLDKIVMCDKKWIFMTTGDNQCSSWTEKELQSTSQGQTCTKKRSWPLFGGLLPVWPTTVFWILVKPLHLEVCSVNQWDTWKTETPAAGIGQQKEPSSSPRQRPTARRTMNVLKAGRIGLRSLASSAIFTWPLANWLPLLQVSRQLFAGKMLPQSARGRKCFPRVHQIPKRGFLYRNKQTFLISKNVLTLMGSYFY